MNFTDLSQLVINDMSGNIANMSLGNYITNKTSGILSNITEAISNNIDGSSVNKIINLPLFNDIPGYNDAISIGFNSTDFVNAENDNDELPVSIVKSDGTVTTDTINSNYLSSLLNDFVSESSALIDIAGCLESNGNDVNIMTKLQNLADGYVQGSTGYSLFNRIKKFTSLNLSGDSMCTLRQLVIGLLSNDDAGYQQEQSVVDWAATTLGSSSSGASPFKAWCATVDLTVNWDNLKNSLATVFGVAYKALQQVSNTIAKGIIKGVRKLKEMTSDPLIYKEIDHSDFDGLHTPLVTWRIDKIYHSSIPDEVLSYYTNGGLGYTDTYMSKFDKGYVYEFSVPGAIIDLLNTDNYFYIGYRPKLYSNHMGIYNQSSQIWGDISNQSDFIVEATQSAISNWNGTPYQWPVVLSNSQYSESNDHKFGLGLDCGSSLFKDFLLSSLNIASGNDTNTFIPGSSNLAYTSQIPSVKFTAASAPTIANVINSIMSATTVTRQWNDGGGQATIGLPAFIKVQDDAVGVCYQDNYAALSDNPFFDYTMNYGKLANYLTLPYLIVNVFGELKESDSFYPYVKGYSFSQGSIDFMTDQEQADKFSNFLKGVGIAIVTVVAVAVAFKLYRKYTNKLAATRGELWTKLGNYDGSVEQAEAIRKLSWKENILCSLSGKGASFSSSSGQTSGSVLNLESFGNSVKNRTKAIFVAITGHE